MVPMVKGTLPGVLLAAVGALCCTLAACHSQKPPETAKVVKPEPKVLTLKVTPTGATVKVDGKVAGSHTLRLLPSDRGYLIAVEKKGYKPFSTRISAQTNVALRVDLERVALDPKKAGLVRILGTSGRRGSVSSIFGRDSALGSDADNALGGLIGDRIGDAYGVGGLGLLGVRSSHRVNGGVAQVNGPLARGEVWQRLRTRLAAVRAVPA